MILVNLVIGVLIAFLCYVYIKPVTWRIIGTIIGLVITVNSLILLTMNSYAHYGMRQVSTIETTQIYPVSSKQGLDIMLYQPLGSKGKETVQIYKEMPGQKKPSHTQANEYTVKNNHIKRTTSAIATLRTTETRWKFKDEQAKFWFGISGTEDKLVRRTNTFYLPKNWLHLSTTQAKKLQKKMAGMKSKNGQAQVKAQAQQYVQQKLKEAIIKDPTIATDKTQQAKLAQKFGEEFQQQLIQKMLADLK